MKTVFSLLLLLWCSVTLAVGPNPARDWRSVDTPHFVVHYVALQRQQAEYFASVAESVYPRITQAFEWQPRAKTEIVLLDAFDFANGFATPLPFNHSAIFFTPPDEGELTEISDWFELVFTHEFTHIVHLDKARGAPNVVRSIFGRQWFTFPNLLQPTWAIEGLATFIESDQEQQQGRLGNSYYDALMTMEVASGVKSLRELNANGRAWPLSKAYLYGAYFYQFLAERYGQSAVFNYVKSYSDNIIPFRVHSNPVAVTGLPMDELWEEYQTWLRARFAVAANDVDESVALNDGQWFTSAPAQAPDGAIFYVENKGLHRPSLRRRVGARDVVLDSVHSGARLYALSSRELLIAQPEIDDNYDYYFDLYRWREHDGLRRLTHGARYRQIRVAGNEQVFALQFNGARYSIDKLDANGNKMSTVYQSDEHQQISSFDISADASRLVVASKRNRQWSLFAINVATGEQHLLLRDRASKHSVYFGTTSDEIYLLADYRHQFNVWRLHNQQLQQLTQTRSAVLHLARPLNEQLVYTQLSEHGEQLRRAAIKPLVTNEIVIEAENPRTLPPLPTLSNERDYAALESLAPRAWLPSGFSGDGAVALGVSVFGQDTLGVHQYVANPMIEVTQKELLGDYWYSYDQRHHLLYSRQMNVDSTRKNSDGDREVDSYTIREHTQWLSSVPFYGIDHTWLAGVGASFDNEKYTVVDIDSLTLPEQHSNVAALYLSYDSRREFFRSEGETDGQLMSLLWESYEPFDSFYQGDVYRAEWRGALGVGGGVFGARILAVRGDETAESFTLGGTFSEPNYGIPLLNWRDVALRGYANGYRELSGNNVNFFSAEWRLPLSDIDRHLMTPPIGINRVSATLFYDRGRAYDAFQRYTDFDARNNRYYDSWGIEINAEIKLGYLFALPLRLGFARGRDVYIGEDQYYVQLGRSF